MFSKPSFKVVISSHRLEVLFTNFIEQKNYKYIIYFNFLDWERKEKVLQFWLLFQNVDRERKGEITNDEFVQLYHYLVHSQAVSLRSV